MVAAVLLSTTPATAVTAALLHTALLALAALVALQLLSLVSAVAVVILLLLALPKPIGTLTWPVSLIMGSSNLDSFEKADGRS